MTQNSTVHDKGRLFWLLVGESPAGPFDLGQIHAKLAAGEITWQSQACPVGESGWRPLTQTPGIGPGVRPDPNRDPVASQGPDTPSSKANAVPLPQLPSTRYWSPAAIAGWGMLFSPIWAGVMAAINGARLRSPIAVWIPLALGFGYLAVDILVSGLFSIDSYALEVVLYAGTLACIWIFVLKPQQALVAGADPSTGRAPWLWPALGGAPLGLLVLFGFLVAPFIPLEPRQVCEKFAEATTAKEAEKYVTANLMPALPVIFNNSGESFDGRFELTDEAVAPSEVGGYYVGFRFVNLKPAEEVQQMSGLFHLVNWSDVWKIEDMYLTTVNDQTLERWMVVSRDYPLMAQGNVQSTPAAITPANQNKTQPANAGQRPWYASPGVGHGALIASGALKKVFLGIGAAIVALFAGCKKLFGQPSTDTPA